MASITSVQDGNWSSPFTWNVSYSIPASSVSAKTFTITTPDAGYSPGDMIFISGSGANDGVYTVSDYTGSVITVAEAVPANGGGGGLSLDAIPQSGDSVTVQNSVSLDVAAAEFLNSLTLIGGGGLNAPDTNTDYLNAIECTIEMKSNATLSNMLVNENVELSENASCTFTNVITNGGAAINIQTGCNLTWSGICNSSGTWSAGDYINGQNLIVNSVGTISVAGSGGITGSITWNCPVVLSGGGGGGNTNQFGNNGVMICNQDMTLDSGDWSVLGTVKVKKMFNVFHVVTGGGAAVELLNNTTANFQTNVGGLIVTYNGPTLGGAFTVGVGI